MKTLILAGCGGIHGSRASTLSEDGIFVGGLIALLCVISFVCIVCTNRNEELKP